MVRQPRAQHAPPLSLHACETEVIQNELAIKAPATTPFHSEGSTGIEKLR